MGAYIVKDNTINKIVSTLAYLRLETYYKVDIDLRYDLSGRSGRLKLAQDLMQLNIDAVNYRHNDKHTPSFTFRDVAPVSEIECLKAIHCWEYQCSVGDIPERPLFKLMERVRLLLAESIVCDLPEYDKAPWG